VCVCVCEERARERERERERESARDKESRCFVEERLRWIVWSDEVT